MQGQNAGVKCNLVDYAVILFGGSMETVFMVHRFHHFLSTLMLPARLILAAAVCLWGFASARDERPFSSGSHIGWTTEE
jgi:hypothetical protein